MRAFLSCFCMIAVVVSVSDAASLGFREFRLGARSAAFKVGDEVRPLRLSWLPFSRDADGSIRFDPSRVAQDSPFSPPSTIRFFREPRGTDLSLGTVKFEYLNLSVWEGVLYEVMLTSSGYDEVSLRTKTFAEARIYLEEAYGLPRRLKQANPTVYVWERDSATIRLAYRFSTPVDRGPAEVKLSFLRSDPEFVVMANQLLQQLEQNRLERESNQKTKSEQERADAAKRATRALMGED